MAKRLSLLFIAIVSLSAFLHAQELTITTWNIEHLGSSGRGFGGGFGAGSLGKRTNQQLRQIGQLIRDTLDSDVMAIQEVAITRVDQGISRSDQLDTIVDELGDSWGYFLPPVEQVPPDSENIHCALLWNEDTVNVLNVFAAEVPNPSLAGAEIFKRPPVIGYFEAVKDGEGTNDFVLVNVHLKSGQDFDENHLIAITVLEHGLTQLLLDSDIKESDRIILGDFNDNPFATTQAGNQAFSTALYDHMSFKKYKDLVTEDIGFTRMDANLSSIIDHILVNISAKGHIPTDVAEKFLPGDSSTFAGWRKTFSDHFPLSFKLTIGDDDDDVDF